MVPAANLSFGFCHSAWEKRLVVGPHRPAERPPQENEKSALVESPKVSDAREKSGASERFPPLVFKSWGEFLPTLELFSADWTEQQKAEHMSSPLTALLKTSLLPR